MRFLTGWIIILGLCVAGASAVDVVELSTGETLRGMVHGQANGIVTFEHPVLGVLKIPANKIKAIVSADQVSQEAKAGTKPQATGAGSGECALW